MLEQSGRLGIQVHIDTHIVRLKKGLTLGNVHVTFLYNSLLENLFRFVARCVTVLPNVTHFLHLTFALIGRREWPFLREPHRMCGARYDFARC